MSNKPEPLKGKIPEEELPYGRVWVSQVRSAVEQVKKDIISLAYQKVGNKIKKIKIDHEKVLKILNIDFADVM